MTNPVQRYAWGSRTALARLQRRTPSGEPEAELWMGAHPAAPSLLGGGNHDHGAAVSLLDRIAQDPESVLGADVLGAFGARLPFLLKVLAIDAPLSLQAHPDPWQAREGFVDEEARGMPVDAPERRYRDPAAKPELLCALTEVEALCGFRDPARGAVLLGSLGVEALDPVARRLAEGPPAQALRDVPARLLTWPEAERPTLVEAVATAARRPAAWTFGAVSLAPASSWCQVTPTSQPAPASAIAVASPIPESDAVTIATLPVAAPPGACHRSGCGGSVD